MTVGAAPSQITPRASIRSAPAGQGHAQDRERDVWGLRATPSARRFTVGSGRILMWTYCGAKPSR